MPSSALSAKDRLLSSVDQGLKTILGAHAAATLPQADKELEPLSPESARLSGALMRVNHVGEICAQALYQSKSLFSRSATLCAHFEHAAKEERDHLAWTSQRVAELGTHTSYLAPLWYGGAFAIGTLAGLAGDKISLSFVVETERQVEQHLASHLDHLPTEDTRSRQIVARMKADEARHAEEAQLAGGTPLPAPVAGLMRLAARVMTRTAHYI